jgi:hypothetical protein
MKINEKALELIEKGLSSKTVSKLDESQINILHLRLVGEQVTEVPSKKTYKVGPKGGKIGDVNISQDPNTKEVMVTAEQDDLENNDALGADAMQSATGRMIWHLMEWMMIAITIEKKWVNLRKRKMVQTHGQFVILK